LYIYWKIIYIYVMKKLVCILILSVFLLSCMQEKKSPIVGAWKLVFLQSYAGDSAVYDLSKVSGTQMKMWSDSNFLFVGNFRLDTLILNNYGGGTYTLEGNSYKENIIYHTEKANVGTIMKMILEIKNDTLTQTYPLKEDGQLDKSNYSIEKYVRLN
jgi:hypothetical protein